MAQKISSVNNSEKILSFFQIEPAALKGVPKCTQANKTEWMVVLDENFDEGRKGESFKCWDNELANLGQRDGFLPHIKNQN